MSSPSSDHQATTDTTYQRFRDSPNDFTEFHDSPEFEQLKSEISSQLFQINGQLSTIQQYVSTLKSFAQHNNINAKAVDKIDKKALVKISSITEILTSINTLLQRSNAIENSALDKTQVIARDKLNRDVAYSLQEFQNVQYAYKAVINEINEIAKKSLQENQTALMLEEENGERGRGNGVDASLREDQSAGNTSAGKGPSQTSHSQMIIEMNPINNEEFVYQQNLIRQRTDEIQNIQSSINEINEIFKDLGSVVHQQGILVDNIEANIYSYADNTNAASSELNKAMRNQRRSGRLCFYMLLALLFVLFIGILATFV